MIKERKMENKITMLTIEEGGKITLPKSAMKLLGTAVGGNIILQETGGGFILAPAGSPF
jgi:bifunctional DNA-binding transcriptional regulator/antitoxin component of YhaV-PrlF toxin-antitoxin module